FAGHCGIDINLDVLADSAADLPAALFNEELGAVIQVRQSDTEAVLAQLSSAGLGDCSAVIGQPRAEQVLSFNFNGEQGHVGTRAAGQQAWSEFSWQFHRLLDRDECGDQEFERVPGDNNPGLRAMLSYDPNEDVAAPFINTGMRPAVAILREQGVNGQV